MFFNLFNQSVNVFRLADNTVFAGTNSIVISSLGSAVLSNVPCLIEPVKTSEETISAGMIFDPVLRMTWRSEDIRVNDIIQLARNGLFYVVINIDNDIFNPFLQIYQHGFIELKITTTT